MYANIICRLLRGLPGEKGVVVKPIVTSDVNMRAQVDCIDIQSDPDGEYRYTMVYQDHLTKPHVLLHCHALLCLHRFVPLTLSSE